MDASRIDEKSNSHRFQSLIVSHDHFYSHNQLSKLYRNR